MVSAMNTIDPTMNQHQSHANSLGLKTILCKKTRRGRLQSMYKKKQKPKKEALRAWQLPKKMRGALYAPCMKRKRAVASRS